MRIEKMHATFGKLREQTLTLAPGMNVICGGNESGKSTWSAFLRVMLYGVSTREKSKTGFLADKEKYAPWSGEPMYGKIEFTWQGRRCVLERRSGRGGVLQKAQISDRDTGEVLDIPEPVGDTLLGVRREVFERSAFIAQAQLPLSGDKTGELERRITALSTTGEEDLSQKLVLDRLKKWQNAIQYNRRGALPDHLARRELVRKNLEDARADAHALTRHHAEIERLREEESAAAAAMTAAKAQAARAELAYLDETERAVEQCEAQLRALEAARPLSEEQRAQIAEKQKQFEESDIKYTECSEKLQKMRAELAACPPCPTGMQRQLLIALACAAAVFTGVAFFGIWVAALAAIAAFGLSVWLLDRAHCAKCGVKNRRALREKAEERERLAQHVALGEEELAQAAELRAQQEELLCSVLRMLREDYCAEDAAAILRDDALHVQEIEAARTQLSHARVRAETAQHGRDREALSRIAEQSAETATGRSAEQLAAQIEESRQARAYHEAQSAALQARIAGRGELGALETEARELDEQIAALRVDQRALSTAIDTLGAIQAEMQRKFAPALERRAGKLFHRFTGGHFEIVQIQDGQMNLAVAERDAAPPRSVLTLSQGTLDELYLAVRLALCEQILPEDAPIFLDDALVNFDDTRMRAALTVLFELAERRQILLFSCHAREAEVARQSGIAQQTL